MSIVYKLAFASSALPSRMIGILNKRTQIGLNEINNSSNELYLFSVFEKSKLSAHARGQALLSASSAKSSHPSKRIHLPVNPWHLCSILCGSHRQNNVKEDFRSSFRVAQHGRIKGGSHPAPTEQRSVWSDLITVITTFWSIHFMLISAHSH